MVFEFIKPLESVRVLFFGIRYVKERGTQGYVDELTDRLREI